MSRKPISIRESETPQRLNIGCGRRHHRDWTNLDLDSSHPDVIRHDVSNGIPFNDDRFDVVYHSHVLEHLNPDAGKQLIRECYRVLQPGGVLRVVVPDLERIARLYLETHQKAWTGDDDSSLDYKWIKLELLDQLVRESSGGQMGKYMASREIKNSDFVRSRVGDEFSVCQTSSADQYQKTLLERISEFTLGFRKRLAKRFIRWTLGRSAESALDEGLFRNQGEIHRWMYDRFSLRELCLETGFVDFRVCSANESQIESYAQFELDSVDGQVRKPDSIFVECVKPGLAAHKAA